MRGGKRERREEREREGREREIKERKRLKGNRMSFNYWSMPADHKFCHVQRTADIFFTSNCLLEYF
jgi:hypothetical protein